MLLDGTLLAPIKRAIHASGERSVFCGAKRSSASDASLLTASCSFRRAILEGGDGGAAWAGDVLPDSTGCS